MNTIVSHSLDDLDKVAAEIHKEARNVRFVALTGDLGAGKTTLVGELLKTFGIEDFNGSPTFSLVNEYVSKDNDSIYHFDFYRITNEIEVFDIGWEDYLSKKGAWCFVEWPERIENILPDHFLLVNIKQDSSSRIFEWKMF